LFVSQVIKNIFNFRLVKFSKPWLVDCAVSNFNFVWLEIAGGDSLKNCKGSLDWLSAIPISVILFILFFKLTHCLLFFGSTWYSFVARWVSCWINFETLWSKLFVAADEGDMYTEWSHTSILWVFLLILPKSLSKHMNWCLIQEFVFMVGCLLSKPGNNIFSIVHISNNNGSAVITDTENVGDGFWNNKFIRNFLLAAYNYGILSSKSDWCLSSLLDSLESILDLVDSSVRGEYLHHFVKSSHIFNAIFIFQIIIIFQKNMVKLSKKI